MHQGICTCKTRNAWQSLACSQFGLAVSPLANSSDTKPTTDRHNT